MAVSATGLSAHIRPIQQMLWRRDSNLNYFRDGGGYDSIDRNMAKMMQPNME